MIHVGLPSLSPCIKSEFRFGVRRALGNDPATPSPAQGRPGRDNDLKISEFYRQTSGQVTNMSDTITLRRLSPDDLETLLAVRHGLFDNAVLPEQAKAFLADPLHEIMLAFDGAEAVGMATGKIMLHPDKQPAFFIAEVGVRDEYQRQGIAKRLFDALMQHARDRGCKGIWLATEADNLPARALYRSLDARETGGIVVYDWDGAMDG